MSDGKKAALKHIYFDTNILFKRPNVSNDIYLLFRVANWVGAGLYMPKVVHDELEGQFVRAVNATHGDLSSDVKELGKLYRDVLEMDVAYSRPLENQLREAFRIRSNYLKEHFQISEVPTLQIPLDELLDLAINRRVPFEEHELPKSKKNRDRLAGRRDLVLNH